MWEFINPSAATVEPEPPPPPPHSKLVQDIIDSLATGMEKWECIPNKKTYYATNWMTPHPKSYRCGDIIIKLTHKGRGDKATLKVVTHPPTFYDEHYGITFPLTDNEESAIITAIESAKQLDADAEEKKFEARRTARINELLARLEQPLTFHTHEEIKPTIKGFLHVTEVVDEGTEANSDGSVNKKASSKILPPVKSKTVEGKAAKRRRNRK